MLLPHAQLCRMAVCLNCVLLCIGGQQGLRALVSLTLDAMIILCSFSSWLSISVFCFTCPTLTFSL